jgi:Tfp pilus assembly protein PilF
MFKAITRLLSYLTFLILVDAVALAATDDWKLCRGSDQNQRVQACTRLAQNPRLPGKERADAYVELGFSFSESDAARAIAAYDKALVLDPKNVTAYIQRGRSNNALQQYGKVVADASRAIEIDPRSAYAYEVRGYAYDATKELALAISDYDKSIELEPSLMRYFERAGIFIEEGAPDRAVADFKKAADFVESGDAGPNNVLVQIVEKLIQIDRIQDTPYVIGKISDGDAMLRLRSLRRFEKLWSTPSASAALSLEQARLRKIAGLHKSSERRPKSLRVKIDLVSALTDAGRLAEAEQVGLDSIAALSSFDDAVKMEPFLRSELGDVLLRQDKFDSAQRAMEPVLRKLGKSADADYIGGTIDYTNGPRY